MTALSRRGFLVGAVRLGTAAGLLAVTGPAGSVFASSAVPVPISHGSRASRQIALTVDDGWGPDAVRTVLGILERTKTKATFMPYARAMRLDPPLWRQVAEAGYPIGNHTNSHPFMTHLTPTQQHCELTVGREVAQELTGQPVLPIFRPPYGDYDTTTLTIAEQAGYPTVVLWDTTDLDTTGTKSTKLMTAAAERGTSGSILLVHGGPPLRAAILPAVIAFYQARGFEFVTLPELLALPTSPTATASRQPTPAATATAVASATGPPASTAAPSLDASPSPASSEPGLAVVVPPTSTPAQDDPTASTGEPVDVASGLEVVAAAAIGGLSLAGVHRYRTRAARAER